MIKNKIITTPISIKDPYYIMGVAPLKGAFDVGYICGNDHGKVNPWSKHKPVKIDKIQQLTEEEFRNQGASVSLYGFKINDATYNILPEFGKLDLIPKWEYLPPGKTDWKRLTDFIGYNHHAEPMIHFKISHLLDSNGFSRYKLDYVLKDSEIPLSDFFEYNNNSPDNPYYRILFIYREQSSDQSDYKCILSKPLHQLNKDTIYSLELGSINPEVKAELSTHMCIGHNLIPSETDEIRFNDLTPLTPLYFSDITGIDYFKVFKNAEGYPKPIFINKVDLLAVNNNYPDVCKLNFNFYFKRATSKNVTVNLSDYELKLFYKDGSGGLFRLLPDNITSDTIIRTDMIGEASTTTNVETSVFAEFTNPDFPQFGSMLTHGFSNAFDESGFPRDNVEVSLTNKYTKEVVLFTSINYKNFIPR